MEPVRSDIVRNGLFVWIAVTLAILAVGSDMTTAADAEARPGSGDGRPVEVTGRVVFDDRDWRAAGAAASGTNVETSLMPAALLKTEFTRPVPAFDPTDDETITCMAEFKGKLYVGSCTQPANTDTGSIFTYDPERHLWEKVFQVNEQELIRLEAYGDTLYVPGYDANNGGWDLGNIYLHDGTTWVERRTVPRAVHTYGLAVHDGRIYLAADIFDEGLKGDNSESRVQLYGRVVSSGDGGLTWREEYRGPTPGQDVGLLTVFKNKLVLNARGDLVVSDGQGWRPLNPDQASYLYVLEHQVDGDRLLLGTPFGLCYFDGARSWRSPFLGDRGHIRGIARYGEDWVFSVSFAGAIRHGPGGTHTYPGRTPVANRPEGFLFVVPAKALDRDARGQDIDFQNDGVRIVPLAEFPTCCRAFRGRLYIGTHPEGRVMVLPVAKEGSLESAPHAMPPAAVCRLFWEVATPPGTAVRFQVRTAATREALASAAFGGPDGTPDTCFDKPGSPLPTPAAGFLQYRAVLTTTDPATTPYLKRVTLSATE